MLLTETATIKLCGRNIEYYNDIGVAGNKGDVVTIPVSLLTKGSEYPVEYECDICHRKIKISMYDYRNKNKSCGMDCCTDCKKEAMKATNLDKFGCENPMQSDEIKNKVKLTMLEKYGEDNAMKVKDTQDKAKETNLKKYGVENCLMSKDIQDKVKKTLIEKYGVEYTFQSPAILEKARKTNLEKYGFENPMQNQEVLSKLVDTLSRRTPEQIAESSEKRKKTNLERYGVDTVLRVESYRHKDVINFSADGEARYSYGQKYVCDLLGGKLNFKDGLFFLDIYFENEKIYIEWDGGGHWISVYQNKMTMLEFNKRQERRRNLILQSGKKEIRFISRKNRIPSDEVLLNMKDVGFELLQKEGYNQVIFDIDESAIKYGDIIKQFEYF